MSETHDTGWRPTQVMFALPLLCALLFLQFGCALPSHPGFPIDSSQAHAARRAMERNPVEPTRPIVVMGGYRAPYFVQVRILCGRLTKMISGKRSDILGLSFFYDGSIEQSADYAIDKIEEKWPSDDPDWTTEVDIVGISMGGLVARQAWSSTHRTDGSQRKRLRIARLFTIATPHRGADLAAAIAPDKPARQMRPGSAFLSALDVADTQRDYALICYARTNDEIVGEHRTAPIGESPFWVHGPLLFSHLTVARDWRITVDIARRLRDEPPFALRTPLPSDAPATD